MILSGTPASAKDVVPPRRRLRPLYRFGFRSSWCWVSVSQGEHLRVALEVGRPPVEQVIQGSASAGVCLCGPHGHAPPVDVCLRLVQPDACFRSVAHDVVDAETWAAHSAQQLAKPKQ